MLFEKTKTNRKRRLAEKTEQNKFLTKVERLLKLENDKKIFWKSRRNF